MKVGVHQGSVLSPLLFAIALDEITKDIREGIPKEYPYADDLVLPGDCWSKVERRYSKWKRALQKGLKIHVNKTKASYTGNIMITQLNAKNAISGCVNDAQELREVWHVSIILNANVVEEM